MVISKTADGISNFVFDQTSNDAAFSPVRVRAKTTTGSVRIFSYAKRGASAPHLG